MLFSVQFVATVVAVVAGYSKPEWIELIPGVTKENNFFRGPQWWIMIYPPFWAQSR